jgi:hypothetical protein
MKVCPACRSRNEDAAAVCWSCVCPLVPPRTETSRPETPRNETPRNQPLRNQPLRNETLRNETLRNEALRSETARNETPPNQAPRNRETVDVANESFGGNRGQAKRAVVAERLEEKPDKSELEPEHHSADRRDEKRNGSNGNTEQKERDEGNDCSERVSKESSDEEAGQSVVQSALPRGPAVNLLAKFGLLIVLVVGIGLVAGGKVWHDYLQQEARQQVLDQAQLMIASATAMRTYTQNQIQPLVGVRRGSEFHPQWVPFYGASQIFKYFTVDYPDYTYKEAALNPMNQRDRALGWEADIVNYFRDNPGRTEISGERDSVTGHSLYFAHPIVAEAGCLECHSSVAEAPPKMVSQYGSSNGFGWKLNEIVGAQIVSVPMSVPLQKAETSFRAWVVSVVGLGMLTVIAVGAGLTFFVSRPVNCATLAADEMSQGKVNALPLPVRGNDEIARLTSAFNRMLQSLGKDRGAR